MFSKYAKNTPNFDTEIMSGMRQYIEHEYGQVISEPLQKQAALKEEAKQEVKPSIFASVVQELVVCAEQLENLGHPMAKEVDQVLSYIDEEMLSPFRVKAEDDEERGDTFKTYMNDLEDESPKSQENPFADEIDPTELLHLIQSVRPDLEEGLLAETVKNDMESDAKDQNSNKDNPYAICHTTVDKEANTAKYDRCVEQVKDKN